MKGTSRLRSLVLVAPDRSRVNDVVSPVGTGAPVYFGWQVNDPDPNEIQTRWQILVASSE